MIHRNGDKSYRFVFLDMVLPISLDLPRWIQDSLYMKIFTRMSSALVVTTLLSAPATLFASDSVASVTDQVTKAAASMEKLNVNTASVEALANIPGIGDKISQSIAAYREAHGAFKSLADLVKIDGIDTDLLDKIKPFLSL